MLLAIQGYLWLFLFAISHLLSITNGAKVKRIYIATQTETTTGNANCSPGEKGMLLEAIAEARNLAKAASNALAVRNSENSVSFKGWFGEGDPNVKKTIKKNHFDQVYASLSLKGSRDIDWDDSTDPGTARVDRGSIVFFCEHGTPGEQGKSCEGDIIAQTWSDRTNSRDSLPFTMVELCPAFFQLERAGFAGPMWQRTRSRFFPTRGGTLIHECQHIHQITGNSRHCIDATVEHNGQEEWCYSPDACWKWLRGRPEIQRKNAQNYRFYSLDALWRPALVRPPSQLLEGEEDDIRYLDNITSVVTDDDLSLTSSSYSFTLSQPSGIWPHIASHSNFSSHAWNQPPISSPSYTFSKPNPSRIPHLFSSHRASSSSTNTITIPTSLVRSSYPVSLKSSTLSTSKSSHSEISSASYTKSNSKTSSSPPISSPSSTRTSTTISAPSSSKSSTFKTSSTTSSSSSTKSAAPTNSSSSSSTISSTTTSLTTTSPSTTSTTISSPTATSSTTTNSSTITTSSMTSSMTTSTTTSTSSSISSSTSSSSTSPSMTSSSSMTSSTTTSTSSSSTSSSSFTTTTNHPVSRTTEYADHGHTVTASKGEVIIAGAGGCFYKYGHKLFHLNPGQTETAGDPKNSPTTISTPSTSSSSTSSSSSSSSTTSEREFDDPGHNRIEDVDIYDLNSSQCSSFDIICSWPLVSTVEILKSLGNYPFIRSNNYKSLASTSTRTSAIIATSTSTITATSIVTDATTTEITALVIITETITSRITTEDNSATTTIWVPATCSCSCLSTPDLPGCPDCCPECAMVGGDFYYPRTTRRGQALNTEVPSLSITRARKGNNRRITSTITDITISVVITTIVSVNSDIFTNTVTSSSTTTTTSITTTTSTITGTICIVCEPGTC